MFCASKRWPAPLPIWLALPSLPFTIWPKRSTISHASFVMTSIPFQYVFANTGQLSQQSEVALCLLVLSETKQDGYSLTLHRLYGMFCLWIAQSRTRCRCATLLPCTTSEAGQVPSRFLLAPSAEISCRLVQGIANGMPLIKLSVHACSFSPFLPLLYQLLSSDNETFPDQPLQLKSGVPCDESKRQRRCGVAEKRSRPILLIGPA
jgi:hypothetical protein